ncbi:hypothetical protein BJ508DRAFT_329386 [Ascobolus immersus RN42]|uniref:Uncharacterized protein n=1 Tax=Ascobolus immersus RN42 TaxID=1160509 RepID=A0A3N4I0M2_ASCIM|nr:hypothetical protein BJ508DRAFT_329386 [Ascobolus immersus RN42]
MQLSTTILVESSTIPQDAPKKNPHPSDLSPFQKEREEHNLQEFRSRINKSTTPHLFHSGLTDDYHNNAFRCSVCQRCFNWPSRNSNEPAKLLGTQHECTTCNRVRCGSCWKETVMRKYLWYGEVYVLVDEKYSLCAYTVSTISPPLALGDSSKIRAERETIEKKLKEGAYEAYWGSGVPVGFGSAEEVTAIREVEREKEQSDDATPKRDPEDTYFQRQPDRSEDERLFRQTQRLNSQEHPHLFISSQTTEEYIAFQCQLCAEDFSSPTNDEGSKLSPIKQHECSTCSRARCDPCWRKTTELCHMTFYPAGVVKFVFPKYALCSYVMPGKKGKVADVLGLKPRREEVKKLMATAYAQMDPADTRVSTESTHSEGTVCCGKPLKLDPHTFYPGRKHRKTQSASPNVEDRHGTCTMCTALLYDYSPDPSTPQDEKGILVGRKWYNCLYCKRRRCGDCWAETKKLAPRVFGEDTKPALSVPEYSHCHFTFDIARLEKLQMNGNSGGSFELLDREEAAVFGRYKRKRQWKKKKKTDEFETIVLSCGTKC